ncbi:MAG: phenylacetate--CoA ligase family protein, partial [Armatimonadota bacterium]|nr:phenylacetate--CoA ligase family protein [Armatimonadota bacterium]
TREDLAKLPILTKEEARKNSKALIATNVNRRQLISRRTSGTTGKSLHFHIGKEALAFQWAVWWRHRKRFGLELNEWHVNFTGELAIPAEQEQPPFWRWNWPMHQALVSMQQVTPAKARDIIQFLNQNDFGYYTGYSSIIHPLVVAARESGVTLRNRPRVIATGGEPMHPWQRRDIQAYTGAVITDQYGFSECCGNASDCPQLVYHEDFEFGILECVDPIRVDGQQVKGKIVCTGFASPEMPFIRYETGDIGIWDESQERCACGRSSRILSSVEGRLNDYVLTPEGMWTKSFDYVFLDQSNVSEAQIIQDLPGEVTLKIVRRTEYSNKDEHLIRKNIRQWISQELNVRFEYVQCIEREPSGKFRFVKSSLDVPSSQPSIQRESTSTAAALGQLQL